MPFPLSRCDLVLIKTVLHMPFDEDLPMATFVHFVLLKLCNSKFFVPILAFS